MSTIGQKNHSTVVLMVPFPLQGHLNQLLHLSRLISAYDIPVHFSATASHNNQARRRIQGWNPLSISNIIFHDLPSLSFQSPRPDPNEPIPTHFQPLIDATPGLRRPVFDLTRRLCAETHRVVIIYDSLMGSVIQDFAGLSNAEAYSFHSVSTYAIFFFRWEGSGRRRPPLEDLDSEILQSLPSPEGCFTQEFMDFVKTQHEYTNLSSGRVYNTCRVLERPFIELLENPDISGSKKQWALGPFNPVGKTESGRGRLMTWLDGLARNSVIFVSFGTTTTLSAIQIQELAMGLEQSEQNFIWVLRDADRGDDDVGLKGNDVMLPEGFEERVRGRGMVVRRWAPQLEILGHVAVGGFMSHCGWNSCMESISMGVPMAAWPMHSDQPWNAVLVTEILKIGIVVRGWDRRQETMKAADIERGVRSLMASPVGEEARRRAAELSGAVREAVAEGGSARLEFESFISHITR